LGPDGEILSYKVVVRNRKGITLRVGKPDGKEVFDEGEKIGCGSSQMEIRRQVGNRGFRSYLGCFEAKDGWVFLSGTTNPI